MLIDFLADQQRHLAQTAEALMESMNKGDDEQPEDQPWP